MAVAIVGVLAGVSSGCGSDDDARRFDVSVQFTTEATQDDIFDVGAFLRTFDDDLEYLILEIFPPIGRAVVTTEAADFCQTVETELGARSYVDDVSCGPYVDILPVDPDEPVSTDND
jgi:hypothetical protein